MTVHRLVQEALTNAVKHAPGAPVSVSLRGETDAIRVSVHNDIGAVRDSDLRMSGGGYGISGMRGRVHQVGGDFEAGPDGSGGWRVSARVPRYADRRRQQKLYVDEPDIRAVGK